MCNKFMMDFVVFKLFSSNLDRIFYVYNLLCLHLDSFLLDLIYPSQLSHEQNIFLTLLKEFPLILPKHAQLLM